MEPSLEELLAVPAIRMRLTTPEVLERFGLTNTRFWTEVAPLLDKAPHITRNHPSWWADQVEQVLQRKGADHRPEPNGKQPSRPKPQPKPTAEERLLAAIQELTPAERERLANSLR
jgi:hypothetical protein